MRVSKFRRAQYSRFNLLSTSGNSAYQMVSGSDPADLYGWGGGGDGDLKVAQGIFFPVQSAQQLRPRAMAQKAAPKAAPAVAAPVVAESIV